MSPISTRCSICPGATEAGLNGPCASRRLSAGWRGSLRNIARAGKQRLDDRQSRPGARGLPGAGMGGVPAAQGHGQAARERERHLAHPRTERRRPARCGDARPVHRAQAETLARAPALAAQLLVIGRTQRAALAAQHQARAERRGRGLCRGQAQGRRRHRRQRAARRFHPRRGRWAGGAAQRRHRLNAGARHAACAGRRSVRGETSGGFTAPAIAPSMRLPRKRARCSNRWPEATAISATARPARTIGQGSISIGPGG